MRRLWRYWPVRALCILGLGWAGVLLLVFAIYNIKLVADVPFSAILIFIIALGAGTGALLARLERNPRFAPPDAGRLSGPALFAALMGLIALGHVAMTATGVYDGHLAPPSFLARAFIALVAAYLPLQFIAHARPRHRGHWVVLGLCVPAMYVASLAALPASAWLLTRTAAGDPGAATVYAALGLTLLALNALPVALTLISGACPLVRRPRKSPAGWLD